MTSWTSSLATAPVAAHFMIFVEEVFESQLKMISNQTLLPVKQRYVFQY